MALISDKEKFTTEIEERKKAWDKLRKIPEYIKDFKSDLGEEECITRWGFYPLADPNSSNENFGFFTFFSSYKPNICRQTSSIDWKGLDLFDVIDRSNSESYDPNTGELRQIDDGDTLYDPNGYVAGKISKKNLVIPLTIDLRFPLHVLVKEFEDQVKTFQKMFKVEIKNTQKHDHLEYLTSCLINLGLSEKDIIQRLLSDDMKLLKSNEKFRKAASEKIRQAIKKQKKV